MPDTIAASLQLPQELTYRQARECLMRLRPLVQGAVGQRVQIDASAVQVFDSSALAVLLACRRAAVAAGKQLQVLGLPKGLQSMATMYGVDGLLFPAQATHLPGTQQQG